MLGRFQISENVPVLMQLLKIIGRILTTDLPHNFIIQIEMSSCPCALLMLRALIISGMASSLIQNEESLAFDIFSELGMALLLISGVHFEAKELLK